MSRLHPSAESDDWLRGACPTCDGHGFIKGRGCEDCDHTGFRAERVGSTGYGWRRLVFWPWHYVQHVRRGRINSWRSRLFCTWCVDDRMRELSRYNDSEFPILRDTDDW